MWIAVLLVQAALTAQPAQTPLRAGAWRAWLDCPGGELPFGLMLEIHGDECSATIENGEEKIRVPHATWSNGELVLSIDHYDSAIRARPSDDGATLTGTWKKRRGADVWAELPFHAEFGATPRFRLLEKTAAPRADFAGRWSVTFTEDGPAVGVFAADEKGGLSGTFLTPTGDYRYLAGVVERDRGRLSCFDGAHAFLFDFRLRDDGTIAGDFWSAANFHDTWTAKRDPTAKLPDAFAETKWTGAVPLSQLEFPDVDGTKRSLGDKSFAGRARIIYIFGSWCPNCHDLTDYMVELQKKYGERGLSIVGLAFELTGDFDRDARQVRAYAAKHGVTYPLLVAGVADKAKASAVFPDLDRIRAYPTTIFLNGDGQIRGVHTGFSGPATGPDYSALRKDFENLIERTLSE